MKLLFVCTGNTCRSCMAEAIAKKEALKMGIDIEILSAGINAFSGGRASYNAVYVMKEMGLDLSCHISKPATKEIIESSDLILTMTESHKNILFKMYPDFKGKIFTLAEYAGYNGDISDPFGGDIEVYRNCALQLKDLIIKILNKIREDKAL